MSIASTWLALSPCGRSARPRESAHEHYPPAPSTGPVRSDAVVGWRGRSANSTACSLPLVYHHGHSDAPDRALV